MPSWEVWGVWEEVEPLVSSALLSELRMSSGDILTACMNQAMQLWTFRQDGKLIGVVVTELVNYPKTRVCQFAVVSGEGRDMYHFEDAIAEWARANGCALMQGIGRRGWAKMPGWREVATVVEKEL